MFRIHTKIPRDLRKSPDSIYNRDPHGYNMGNLLGPTWDPVIYDRGHSKGPMWARRGQPMSIPAAIWAAHIGPICTHLCCLPIPGLPTLVLSAPHLCCLAVTGLPTRASYHLCCLAVTSFHHKSSGLVAYCSR